MKKSLYILLILMMTAVWSVGCGSEKKSQSESGDEKLKVLASFYPMYDFAQKVGGDKVEVTNMVPAGTEPHDWEPTATDIRQLEDADVFVYNGAGMEHWAEDVLASLDNQDIIIVEASKGLEFIEGEAHEDEEDEAEHEEDEEEHDTGYDPHVWLDPLNAKAEMENIKNALVEADPENEAYYTENYEEYSVKFDQLDEKYKEELADMKGKDIIVAHEAFGYLCNAYDLNQVGIEGLSPDSEPDPARMKEIIEFAKENQIKTIYFEELVSPKVAETIAAEVGAKTSVLNPLEGLNDEQIKAGEDYFSIMEENLTALKEG